MRILIRVRSCPLHGTFQELLEILLELCDFWGRGSFGQGLNDLREPVLRVFDGAVIGSVLARYADAVDDLNDDLSRRSVFGFEYSQPMIGHSTVDCSV